MATQHLVGDVPVNYGLGFGTGQIRTFTRGEKLFELSNHLGNVLVTISDRRQQNSAGGTVVDSYAADLLNANDYYPFGMQMPGRKFAAGTSGYRYGFNGKENDNEVKGPGNQQDYGMRIYDPRIAKFLSVDPLTKGYPMLTPYQFAGNMPTIAIDLDGAEPMISPKTYGEMKDPMQAVKGAAEITIGNTKRFLSGMGNTFFGLVGGILQPIDAGHFGDKISKDRWAQTFPLLPNNNIAKDLIVPALMAPVDVANRIRDNPFDAESWGEAAAIVVLAKGGSFVGKFKSADFGLKVDLMGGENSRYGNGYINFDRNAKSGIKADISDFKNHFGDNTISEMIVDNPQAPFLEIVSGALQSGGTITIRGGMSNRNFNSVFNGKAEGLNAFDVISKKEKVTNPGYKQNDGTTPVGGEINEIILRKKK